MNGKQGYTEVCDEFTRQFQSVITTNTAHSDDTYETELQELMRTNTDFDYNNKLKVDIDSLQYCLRKLKLNKSSGVDNISASVIGRRRRRTSGVWWYCPADSFMFAF